MDPSPPRLLWTGTRSGREGERWRTRMRKKLRLPAAGWAGLEEKGGRVINNWPSGKDDELMEV